MGALLVMGVISPGFNLLLALYVVFGELGALAPAVSYYANERLKGRRAARLLGRARLMWLRMALYAAVAGPVAVAIVEKVLPHTVGDLRYSLPVAFAGGNSALLIIQALGEFAVQGAKSGGSVLGALARVVGAGGVGAGGRLGNSEGRADNSNEDQPGESSDAESGVEGQS